MIFVRDSTKAPHLFMSMVWTEKFEPNRKLVFKLLPCKKMTLAKKLQLAFWK